jgi:hypothetical protein
MDFSLVVDGQIRIFGGNLVPIGTLLDVEERNFRQALGGAALEQDAFNVRSAIHVARPGMFQGREDFLSAVGANQIENLLEVLRGAAFGAQEPLHESGGWGPQFAETFCQNEAEMFAFGAQDAIVVAGVFNHDGPLKTACVSGDFGGVGQESHLGGRGFQNQRLVGISVGDGIEITLKAHQGLVAGAQGARDGGIEGLGRKRDQQWFFFLPKIDRTSACGAVLADVGRALEPGADLGVNVGPENGSSGQEIDPKVEDAVFDFSFFIAPGDVAGRGFKTVDAGELQEGGVESYVGAQPGDDNRLEVVIPNFPGHTPEKLESVDVALDKVFQALRQSEFHIHHSAIGQHHHKGRQLSFDAADLHGAAVGPVALPLFARGRFNPEEHFFGFLAQGLQIILHDPHGPRISLGLEFLMDHGGGQVRVGF